MICKLLLYLKTIRNSVSPVLRSFMGQYVRLVASLNELWARLGGAADIPKLQSIRFDTLKHFF